MTVVVDGAGTAEVSYDTDDFPRWRTSIFEQVKVARIVDYLGRYLKWGQGHAHAFAHIGLSACCSCGWEERKFWSETAARCAWWEHAEPLLDWDTVEAEIALEALSR